MYTIIIIHVSLICTFAEAISHCFHLFHLCWIQISYTPSHKCICYQMSKSMTAKEGLDTWMVAHVSPYILKQKSPWLPFSLHVSRGGAATGQLLAELLCPWLLGFLPAASTHSSTLSLTLINVHTCWCICGHMHTQRRTRTDTCAQTHAGSETEGDICSSTCSQSSSSCLLMSRYAQLHSHVHTSMTTTAGLTQRCGYNEIQSDCAKSFFVLHNFKLHGPWAAPETTDWQSPGGVEELQSADALQVGKKMEWIYF